MTGRPSRYSIRAHSARFANPRGPMNSYALTDPADVPSPALLFYPALIRQNLRRA